MWMRILKNKRSMRQAPNEGERLEILKCLLEEKQVAPDVSLQDLATQTAALLAGDLRDLVVRAKGAAVERAASTVYVSTLKHQYKRLTLISIVVILRFHSRQPILKLRCRKQEIRTRKA